MDGMGNIFLAVYFRYSSLLCPSSRDGCWDFGAAKVKSQIGLLADFVFPRIADMGVSKNMGKPPNHTF